MKAWALVALVAAESGLRGHPVLVVHHKPHRASLLQRGSHAVRHARTGGVDLSTLSDGEVATSGIIHGAGAYPEENTGAAASAAPPSALAAAPVADDDAASVVFGGAGEAPTREELRIVHEQQMAKAAAKAPAPPYKVTLDLGPPPPLPSEPAASAPVAPAPVAAAPVVPAPVAPAPPASMLHTDAKVQHEQTQQQVQQQMVRMEQQAQAQQQVAAQTETQASATPTGITRPKGWDQCLKFSRFIKAQGVTGMELVKTWKATCEPAVSSGVATERYKVMCNALGGTVEPFAAQQDYDVEKLCDAVLAVFHDVTAVDVKASS